MNANRKLMNLQLFAVPTNETTTSDLAPAISVDFTTRISENINTLQEILGVTNMTPMAAGTLIKLYREEVTVAEQVAAVKPRLVEPIDLIRRRVEEGNEVLAHGGSLAWRANTC